MHDYEKKQILKSINSELKETEKLIKIYEKKISPDFEGARLRINARAQSAQYYVTFKGEDEVYLKKDEKTLLKSIAQEAYNEDLLKKAQQQFRCLLAIRNKVDKCTDLHNIYDGYIPERQALVTPYEPPFEEFARKWVEKNSHVSDFHSDYLNYTTKAGVAVRSKSEMLIADALSDCGLWFIYEKRLILKDTTSVYPDFTILDPVTKSEVYYEHFGMMTNEKYCTDAISKINKYTANGYELGKDLLVSFEGDGAPIVMSNIKNVLKQRFQL